MSVAVRALEDIPTVGTAREQLHLMQSDRLGGLLRFNDTCGDMGRFTFVFGDVLLVNTPELVHDVLVAKAKSFEKSPVMRAALHPLAGQGLFTSEGELWRKQRRLMAPMFHDEMIRGFAADMTGAALRAVGTWRDGQTVDVAHETTRITMAIAGKTLFDIDTFDESDELGDALSTALAWAGEASASLSLVAQARLSIGLDLIAGHLPAPLAGHVRTLADKVIVPIPWPTPRMRALRRALAVLDARVERMIADRRARPGERRDLLGLLLSARGEDGETMSDRQVRDEVLTLFVAGHETTATSLAWALMLLAQHPAIHDAAKAEARAVGHVPTAADLPRLALLTRVFKESMRLYPPVYLFGRVAVADVELGGFRVPAGTVVLVSPFALHRRAHLYPDPERFDPDRFLPAAEAARHKTAYFPFSAGPRTCIGNQFALMEGALVLATILQRADLELVDARGAQPEPQATLRLGGGLPMRVRLRAPERAAEASSPSPA